jgi:predicted nucleic acid-binding protein
VICCDTSFLVSLYGYDVHSAKAMSAVRSSGSALFCSLFNEYELVNGIHLRVWRGLSTQEEANVILASFKADLEQAILRRPTINLAAVLVEAQRLSTAFTAHGGHRAFDILHIAAAVHLGALEFLTFDLNQRKLATAAGLKPGPEPASLTNF